MSFTYRAGNTLSTDAGTFSTFTLDITGTGIAKFEEVIATGGDTTITVAVDVSAVKAFGVKSTKDVTLKINDDGTPDATIALTANVPLTWVASLAGTQYPTSNPLGSVDITSIDVNNMSGANATVTFACLTDATP